MTYPEFKARYALTPDPQQEAAILRAEGPTLLLAVPGSGKTTTLVTRLGYLIHCLGAVSYTHLTGTRYMNVEGMLPFENLVADYVKETSNHVLYRVTPLYEGDNLVASGVLMEAGSVEDEREGVCFNVYVYNVQPGIGIDYATGASWTEGEQGEIQSSPTPAGTAYVLNTNTKKFHLPTCASVEDMKPENRTDYTGSREALLDEGYSPCGQCKP